MAFDQHKYVAVHKHCQRACHARQRNKHCGESEIWYRQGMLRTESGTADENSPTSRRYKYSEIQPQCARYIPTSIQPPKQLKRCHHCCQKHARLWRSLVTAFTGYRKGGNVPLCNRSADETAQNTDLAERCLLTLTILYACCLA